MSWNTNLFGPLVYYKNYFNSDNNYVYQYVQVAHCNREK